MRLGIYENRLGVKLRVTQSIYGLGPYESLGGIYEAESVDQTGWTAALYWLVTEQSLKDAGYVYVDPFPSDFQACGKGKCADTAGHEGECAY